MKDGILFREVLVLGSVFFVSSLIFLVETELLSCCLWGVLRT